MRVIFELVILIVMDKYYSYLLGDLSCFMSVNPTIVLHLIYNENVTNECLLEY